MRISPVLTHRDLPFEELQAGVLDGELVRIGPGFCVIDAIVTAEHRAASLAPEIPPRSIAERHTAAWIYGFAQRIPARLQLCVDSRSKWRPFSTRRCEFREVVLRDDEIIMINGLPVTAPLRTALDLARIDPEFTAHSREVIRGLASWGSGFGLESCARALGGRRNLPNKLLALSRLAEALGERPENQFALTR